MAEKMIKAGDADFTIRAKVPDEVRGATGYTITITDNAGTLLVDDDTADVGKPDTLDGTAEAGSTTLVLTYTSTPYTPLAGDVLLVGDDETGYQSLTVRAFDVATRTVTTREFIDWAYPDNTTVEWREVSYALDASAAAWTDLNEVTVTWTPDNDCLPWTERFQVLARTAAIGGLESEFKTAYPRYHEQIPAGSFPSFAERARQRMRLYFESRGRNFDKIVDSPRIKDPMLLMLAVLVAEANSDRFEAEHKRLSTTLSDVLAMLDQLPLWVDSDQNLVKEEEEEQPAIRPGLMRGL